jgi:ADP-ribose pyrophosphatase YjhB (NUDIX family)
MNKRISGRAIIIDKDEVILLFRRKLKDGIIKEYYAIPGGGKEDNETIEECVKREIKEELSLDVEIIKYLDQVEDEKNIGYVYQVKIIGGELKLGGEELEKNNPDNYYEPRRIKLKDIDNIELLEKNKELIKKCME